MQSPTTVGELKLQLRVDRIDGVRGGRVIIDYKTGVVKKDAWEGTRPDEPQLLLYARQVEELQGLLLGRVRAGEVKFIGRVKDSNAVLPAEGNLSKPPLSARMLQDWQDLDALLHCLFGRLPGLLTIVISLVFRVGEQLLALLLQVSAHAGQFSVKLFLGFRIVGFQGFSLCGHLRQQLFHTARALLKRAFDALTEAFSLFRGCVLCGDHYHGYLTPVRILAQDLQELESDIASSPQDMRGVDEEDVPGGQISEQLEVDVFNLFAEPRNG